MTYYRVKLEYDNAVVVKQHRVNNFTYTYKNNRFLVGGELLTERELKRLYPESYKYVISENRARCTPIEEVFEPYIISKNKTYWFFGARFPMLE